MVLRISLPHLRLLSTMRVLPRYCSHFLEEKVLPAAKVVLSLLPLGAPVFHTFPLQTPTMPIPYRALVQGDHSDP